MNMTMKLFMTQNRLLDRLLDSIVIRVERSCQRGYELFETSPNLKGAVLSGMLLQAIVFFQMGWMQVAQAQFGGGLGASFFNAICQVSTKFSAPVAFMILSVAVVFTIFAIIMKKANFIEVIIDIILVLLAMIALPRILYTVGNNISLLRETMNSILGSADCQALFVGN